MADEHRPVLASAVVFRAVHDDVHFPDDLHLAAVDGGLEDLHRTLMKQESVVVGLRSVGQDDAAFAGSREVVEDPLGLEATHFHIVETEVDIEVADFD